MKIKTGEENENCGLVEGIIKADDYCDLYEPKEDSPDTMATEPEEMEQIGVEIQIHLLQKSDGNVDFTGSFLNYMETEWDSSKVQKQVTVTDEHPSFNWGEYGLVKQGRK